MGFVRKHDTLKNGSHTDLVATKEWAGRHLQLGLLARTEELVISLGPANGLLGA